MKKNKLFSLVVLPLFVPALTIAMETPNNSSTGPEKGYLSDSSIIAIIEKIGPEKAHDLVEKARQSNTSSENQPSNQVIQEEHIEETLLYQSMLLPKEEKGISARDKLPVLFSNYRTQAKYFLENGSFQTDNKSYFNVLNNAIKEAIEKNDFEYLATINALCQKEQYNGKIRIDDAVAKQATSYLANIHTLQLQQANKNISNTQCTVARQFNDRADAFTNAVKMETKAFKLATQQLELNFNKVADTEKTNMDKLQKTILEFSALNNSTRKELQDLVEQHKLTIPKNIITATQEPSELRIASIERRATIPMIYSVDSQQPLTLTDR